MNDKKVVHVRDVMRAEAIIMPGVETVAAALSRMRSSDARCVIVDKRHDDDEFGIVLLADIAKQVLARDRSPDRVNLYEVMSKPVLSVAPDMDIRYTARLFERFGLTMAPVIEASKVLGIVAYADIVLRGMSWD